MKKAVALLFLVMVFFSSCDKEEKFIPPSGEYVLEYEADGISYILNVEIDDTLSGTVRFPENSAMSDWYFTRDGDGKIKCFTSLGEETEVKHENIDRIFDFITLSYESIADVSHEKISGRDVSVLKISDGTLVYTDSQSGEPMKLIYQDIKIDIKMRPGGN